MGIFQGQAGRTILIEIQGCILGKVLKTIATSIGFTLLLFCLGCGNGLVQSGTTPSISQILPQTIVAGSNSLTLKVTGTNFSNHTVILWNGATLATSVVDPNTLAGTIDSSSLSVPATVQLRVQNAQTKEESRSVPVTIASSAPVTAASTLAISTTSLSQATAGTPYTATLAATGGTPAYTWSIAGGKLPAGLDLSASTGIISGTPTESGAFSLTAKVADSASPAQRTSATISLVVAPASLTITSSTLRSGTQGSSYSNPLQASGGTAPYTWSVTSGTLPPGLSLAATTGIVSGTPTVSGTFSFTATVADSESPAQTKSVTTSIVVAPASLAITSSTLSSGTSGTAYSSTLQASGGTAPYTWSITSGTLPAGLTLSSTTGVISGTPTAAGTFSFTARVADSASPAQKTSATISLVVAPASLTIISSTLPSGTSGTAYSSALQASGGTPTYTWSVTSGSLPAGLTMSAATGAISGTPTATGTSSFTATVNDNGNPVQKKSATTSIVVAPASLTITYSTLLSGTQGTSYSSSLQASGGTAPYTWSVTSGSLPAGLTLSATTGVISGTPTATGTSSFTATVTDSGSPAQTKSVTTSIVVASSSLTITSSTLPAGTSGTAYSSPLQASGGTPAYTWSIASGSLPAGLTLAATTGVISGTPTATGTSSFTAAVSDNGNPVQTKSAATSITVAAAQQSAGPGTTWYIRADGGTRYSANNTQGQCDGKGDNAYSGSGTNQHCAFKDYRYLWDDQSYNNSAWVISGGDTVIIRGGPWRIGWDSNTGPGAGYTWCLGSNNAGCFNPIIPSGTSSQHTRILGENFASCSNGTALDKSKLTQIFGGFGVITPLNLRGAQYVDVQCIEVTRHSQCMVFGSPAYPSNCGNSPLDDYDSDGVQTDVSTHDLLMQDMWIHGHTGRGVKGPIGGVVTCLRCDIAYNGAAGWDFDDGSSTKLVNAVWNFNYSTIEWNGCNEEYPITHTYPAISCYGQSTGGYGDGVGTPAGTGMTVNIDHSAFSYNTQDGLDLGHIDTGGPYALTITNSTFVGNGGGALKWGANFLTATVTNNLVMSNCSRMSAPMTGAPSTYNANLSDFCRAGDANSYNFRQGGTATVANNTFVTYAPTIFDIGCWDASCSTSTSTFKNNIVLAYSNSAISDYGGTSGPGLFYYGQSIGNVVRSNNLYYGIGHGFTCPTGFSAELCQNPLFVNQPTWTGESSLDNFNFNITSGSPATGAGTPIPGLTLDYTGQTRGNPPSIGAYE